MATRPRGLDGPLVRWDGRGVNMVGESNGHREATPSDGNGGGQQRHGGKGEAARPRPANGPGDPRTALLRASECGRLDCTQARALSDLLSRTSVLGFESKRLISVMVTNIALEDSREKRVELAVQLREYLEGDGLAKDLVPSICCAFKLT